MSIIVDEPKAYHEGLRDGVRMYAWWKDGKTWVGSGGTTLKEALAKIDQQESVEREWQG